MDFSIQSFEIVKFKSITNQVRFAGLSAVSNVVIVPFDSALGDDLIDAFEYALGSKIHISDSADVVITIVSRNAIKKLRRRSDAGTQSDEYFVNEGDEPRQVGKADYLAQLNLSETNAAVFNRNGNFSQLATSSSAMPFLEEFRKSAVSTEEMLQMQHEKDARQAKMQNVDKYCTVLKKHEKLWKLRAEGFQKELEHEKYCCEMIGRNTVAPESLPFNEAGDLDFDAIIAMLSTTIDGQPIEHGPDELLEQILSEEIGDDFDVDKEMGPLLGHSEFAEYAKRTSDAAYEQSLQHMQHWKPAETRTAPEFQSTKLCHHQQELELMQSKMQAKLDDYAFRLENLCLPPFQSDAEMPRRLYEMIDSPTDSVAFDECARMIVVHSKKEAKQMLSTLEDNQRVNLILEANSGLFDVVAERQDTEHVPVLNKLGILEYRSTGAIEKTEQKIYSAADCLRFCALAVAELPQLYPLVDCIPLNGEQGIVEALQQHQHELHEQFIGRLKAKWNEWQHSELEKCIELDEIEHISSASTKLHLVLAISPFGTGLGRSSFYGERTGICRDTKKELNTMNRERRKCRNEFYDIGIRLQELKDARYEALTEFYRNLSKSMAPVGTFLLGEDIDPTTSSSFEASRPEPNYYLNSLSTLLSVNRCQDLLLITPDFYGFMAPSEVDNFLEYVVRQTKQKIIILSKPHDIATQVDRAFWLFRNKEDLCEVLRHEPPPQ